MAGGKGSASRYFVKTGEFRPPLKGEFYLSGAIPEVYLAPNNLSMSFNIMVEAAFTRRLYMTLIIENENALADALHCCDLDVTRENPMHQRYGRGIIMGMRAAYMSQGIFLTVADAIIKSQLPLRMDPACYPDNFPQIGKAKGRFKVHEHFNGFSLEDTKTGYTHWLSDGVDCVGSGKEGECNY